MHVTLEEGTCAAWLHDLLKPHVSQVLVCDPRKNALLKSGNKTRDATYRFDGKEYKLWREKWTENPK